MKRSSLYWICQFAGWGGLVALNFLLDALAGRRPFQLVASTLAVATTGLVATHLVRLWIRSHRWLDGSRSALVLRSTVAALGLGLVIAAAGSAVARWMGQASAGSHTFLWIMMLGTGVGLAWIAIYLGAHALERLERERRRSSELEVASREAELHALKAQLNPHFMFNSLNAIRALIDEDPERARDAVTRLAGLMRYATTATSSSKVPLARELDTVRSYLELERVRFENRLETTFEIDSALRDELVPPLILQTLVENAVKHGISRMPSGGSIRVAAERSGSRLHLEVANSGSLRPAEESSGIGLANLRQRLELLYGNGSRLDLREHGGEVIATVALPTGVEIAHS